MVTDANLLTTRLCGSSLMKDEEDPALGPDEAYPDWLWTLHTDTKPVPLENLSEDDPLYWRRLRKMTIRENNKYIRIKKKY